MAAPHEINERAGAKPLKELSDRKLSRLVFGLAIFTSAFLLFQVQLILGKFLLPWFGGTSAVWTTCLLFFQLFLLAGYLYAHKISASLGLNRQGRVHLAFLILTGLWTVFAWYSWGSPFLPGVQLKPVPGSAPIFGILKLLLLAIGLPFLLLSSTTPLLQSWYDQIHHSGRTEPSYFFYALSNAGSLLGLLSYPILLEPAFGLDLQSRIWGAGFAFFIFCCAICGWHALRSRQAQESSPAGVKPSTERATSASRPKRWLWFALPALGSVMLLATTNLLTQDVAPIPLLWVLPLCAYLLSFVFTFQRRNWYSRGLFHPLFAIITLMAVIALFRGTDMDVFRQIGVFLAMLFVACMVCHGELARIKPEARHLTAFYLTLSAGGAFGGIFVGLIAPLIFPAIWEYHIGLWAIAALLALILFLDKGSWLHDPKPDPWIPVALFAIICLVPKYLARIGLITIPARIVSPYNIGLIVVVLISIWVAFGGGGQRARRRACRWYEATVGASILLLSAALVMHLTGQKGRLLYRERNFYGALAVRQQWDNDMLHSYVLLTHGRITHGIQLEQQRKVPTTYYDERSGAGLALTTHPRRASGGEMRVGAIGLGVGTLAAYSRAGDVYRFYEINPAVVRLARGAGGYFTFLKDSPAQIDIAVGDARLSLEAEAARHEFQDFDVLVVDAFNGDSIPIHLLTREAMKLYLSHLRGPDSIIAVHISNLAVDLGPVVANLAKFYEMKSARITTGLNNGPIQPSDWILLTRGNLLDAPEIQHARKPMLLTNTSLGTGLIDVWSDDHSNVISLLRYHGVPMGSWLSKRLQRD
jgi:hypothetical protein